MDIDDVLKGEQMLPCQLLHEGRHLAWLDPTAHPSQPLEPESELSLPLWLAEPLAKRRHVEIKLPKFYGTAYRNALREGVKADLVVGKDLIDLDLRQHSEFYFDTGVQLSSLLEDEEDLAGLMLTGFSQRFHRLLDASLNVTTTVDSSSIKEKLTLREKQLFDAGRSAALQYHNWKADQTRGRIQQSALVAAGPRVHGKKRTRAGLAAAPPNQK